MQLQLTCWISCRSFLSALLAMGLGATTWPSSVEAPATAAVVASCPTYSSNLMGHSAESKLLLQWTARLQKGCSVKLFEEVQSSTSTCHHKSRRDQAVWWQAWHSLQLHLH